MEACKSTLTLVTDSLTDSLICLYNALLSHLKVIPQFQACYIYILMKRKLSIYYHIFFLIKSSPFVFSF